MENLPTSSLPASIVPRASPSETSPQRLLGGDVDCVDVAAASGGRGRGRGKAGTVSVEDVMPCTLLETLTELMSRLVVEELVFKEDLNI